MSNADAANFPDPATTSAYNLTDWAANQNPLSSNAEVLRVTAKGAANSGGNGNTQFTVTRVNEQNYAGSMAARSVQVGDWISNNVTRKWFTDIETNKLDIDGTMAMTGSLTLASKTTTQINALTPINGMLINNSTINQIKKYENSQWVDISKSPATKVVAPAGSGYAADYYTTGTSDNVQIQAGLDAINTAGGGTLLLSPGFSYNITATLVTYSKVKLIAYGATINMTAGSNVPMLKDSDHKNATGAVDHISVWGGIWNGGTLTVTANPLMLLGGSKLDVRDLEFKSSGAQCFSFIIHNVTDFYIENIFFNDVSSDGLHISGPSARGTVKNIYGKSYDDLVVLNNYDTRLSSGGDITDIFIDGIRPINMSRANPLKILSGKNGSTVYNTKRINIKNISGALSSGITSGMYIGDDTGFTGTFDGQLDDITIENINLTFADNAVPIVKIVGSSTSLTIPNMKFNNITLNSDCAGIIDVQHAKITNLTVNNVIGATATVNMTAVIIDELSSALISNLMLNNINIDQTVRGGAIIKSFDCFKLSYVYMNNIYGNNFSQISDTNVATQYYLSNVNLTNNTELFHIRASGAITIEASNGLVAGNTSSSFISGGTLESKSPMFPLATTASGIIVNKGDMAYNTDAAATTGVGPVAYNGSVWEPMALTQSLYSTSSPTFAGLTLTGNIAMGSNKITGMLDPTSAQDAATKSYVDSVATGLDVKASVRVATTANITLSGTQTIDGVAVIAGDRVLVKNQTTAADNGIYVVASGSWTRATDADASIEVTSGMFTFISEGTVNANMGFVLTTADPITLGTTALTFTQFSGAGEITAGTGLTKSANTLSIDTAYSGQSSITTLGTITTGVWTGTTIAVANGGTGQASYTDGQLLIGNTTGNTLAKAALTAGNSMTVTNGHGSITLDAIQDIRTSASPTFVGLTLSGASVMTSASAANVIPLTINQNDTTNNPSALVINNTGSGVTVDIQAANKANSANSTTAAMFRIMSTDSQAQDKGGSLILGGYIVGTSTAQPFAAIAGRKENGTSANSRGYLQFLTGGVEQARIDSNGHMGIGVTTVSSFLHLKAGTATANTAPLQFSSGTLETTARAGLHEYNGNHYLTAAGLQRFSVGGTLFDHFADGTSTSTNGTFDDLYTDTTAANTFNTNGDKIIARYSGTFIGSATATRDIKVLFAGTTILDTGALTTATADAWDITIMIIRESSTVVRCIATIIASTTTGLQAFNDITYTRITGLTLSGTNILKIQGAAASTGAAGGDITGKLATILFQPAV